MLTIEVWHQTSRSKSKNNLRIVQVGFYLASADKAGEELAAAVHDPVTKTTVILSNTLLSFYHRTPHPITF